jgi:hypothetical protein
MFDAYATRENIGRRARKDGDEVDVFHRDPGPRFTSAHNAKRRVSRRNRRAVGQHLRSDRYADYR